MMAGLVLLIVAAVLLGTRWALRRSNKPRLTDPVFWQRDGEFAARARWEAAVDDWRAGRLPVAAPEGAASEFPADIRAQIVRPNDEVPLKRLVRVHPMRPPEWV